MERNEALELLFGGQEGIAAWNRWRESVDGFFDLSGARFDRIEIRDDGYRRVDLRGADLRRTTLIGASFKLANLCGANLGGSPLQVSDFDGADLTGASLRGAHLAATSFHRAILNGADFSESTCDATTFVDVDLSEAKGLDLLQHEGPSTVGIDTLFRSKGKISEVFLRGCGVPTYLIDNQKALIGSMEPIQFYSCFISFSTDNQDFAEQLHSKMRDKGLRVWFAPEDVKGGRILHEQIDEAIRLYDKLLLVLSRQSMKSAWVQTEIRKARKAERESGRRKLFPIRLVDFKSLQEWECFDSDSGKDLAVDIRAYFIPDFSKWKDHDLFEAAWTHLQNDLKAEELVGSIASTRRASRRKKPH